MQRFPTRSGTPRGCAARRRLRHGLVRTLAVACLLLGADSLLGLHAQTQRGHVSRIAIDASINPAVGDFIRENVQAAADAGALALIVQLDTPGGLLSSTKSIVKDVLGAPLPVLLYVSPSGAGAGSAGVFITLAGHVAAMAPGTTIGAAHPVASGGQNIEGDMRDKIENYAASFIESIAQRRGRNVEWAEQAVRESVSITEVEALEKNVVDLVAVDVHDLLAQAHGREVEVGTQTLTLDFSPARLGEGRFRIVAADMRLKHKVLNILADPNIAYLLMMAGMLGLYLEFSNPGLLLPGLAGGICLILALTAFQVLPINYTGLVLIGLGMALLVAEMFLPSFGILGVSGIAAFVLGSLFLFDTPDAELAVDRTIILAASLAVSLFMFVVGILAARAWWRPAASGLEALRGAVGEVRTPLAPRGTVWVHGEYWTAESDEAIEAGQKVRIVEVNHMVLRVRRAAG